MLERCEHDLTDHHLYFLGNLVDWADEKIFLDPDWLLDAMRERINSIAQRLMKIKQNEIEHGVTIQLYREYVFDPDDLTYGLEDDLRGI